MSNRIPAIEHGALPCRCSECVCEPTRSHGIHLIGSYTLPRRLARRGGRRMEASVSYHMGNRWSVHPVFASAQGDTREEWI
jgi:hypothetical protein